ncbi:MAG: ATP-binding protein [candidate division Zixibacteria bacterium]|jgi:serine/threonine-protein kinase RsbW|nr:ATP-binding protein [candidate division Zixibacteria bacterium]
MDKPQISGNTIIIPSSTRFLADVDEFVEGLLRDWGTSASVIADIAISVSELVNNAVVHGNKASPNGVVTVSMRREGDTVTIDVADEGTGFNPAEIDDPLKEENLLKEVGRGIFIVEQLMDKVDIAVSKRGTTISISKAIA